MDERVSINLTSIDVALGNGRATLHPKSKCPTLFLSCDKKQERGGEEDNYRQTTAHKVQQVRVLNLEDGHRDGLLVPLDLWDLWSLLRQNGRHVKTLEQQVPIDYVADT